MKLRILVIAIGFAVSIGAVVSVEAVASEHFDVCCSGPGDCAAGERCCDLGYPDCAGEAPGYCRSACPKSADAQ